jgi:hypothetical protein
MQRIVYTSLSTESTAITPQTLFAAKPPMLFTDLEKLEQKLHETTRQLRNLYHGNNHDMEKQKSVENTVRELMLAIKEKSKGSPSSSSPKM